MCSNFSFICIKNLSGKTVSLVDKFSVILFLSMLEVFQQATCFITILIIFVEKLISVNNGS